MVRQLLIIFIFLASASFFSIAVLPRQILLVLMFSSIALLVLTFIIYNVYDRRKGIPQKFNLEISLILFSSITALFGAQWGHGQNYLLSAWAQSYIYFYFFYYFLHIVRIRVELLIRLMLFMSIGFLLLWYIQYLVYPRMLVDTRVDMDRGTIRLFLPGGTFAGLLYFYFLDLYLRTDKVKFLIFCFFYLLIPVLQGTRSSIAIQLFGTLLFILFSTQVRSKLRTLILVFAGAFLIFILFQDIFINLLNITMEQSAQQGEDIRVRSATFFLTDFYPNKINYFLGNGIGHMMSGYGMKMAYYKVTYGYYQSDVGLIGNYTQFGLLFILGVFLIIRKIFITKIQKEHEFVKYWVVLLVISLVLGSPFTRPYSIVVIASVLYMIDVSSFQLLHDHED